MKKIIIQALLTLAIFLGIWFAFTQINWVKIMKVKQVTDKTEEKLGILFWDIFKKTEVEITDKETLKSLDSIVTHICKSNKIERAKIKVHVLYKDEVNAFALPNGHLVIFSGLILNAENQEELAGVICHEIAHIELNHVMKKLVKEIGLSVLISMTTGNSSGELAKETAKILSSTAFDRSLEKEADLKAVDYLVQAKINPEPFANFLYKLSENEHEVMKYMTWISTHPNSKERAEYIIEYSHGKSTNFKSIISNETWNQLIEDLE
jgi:predicted Zn-dependent protease